MSNLFSIDEFRKPQRDPSSTEAGSGTDAPARKAAEKSRSGAALPPPRLTKSGEGFRRRFIDALGEIKVQAAAQLATAGKADELKIKINVSAVLKAAKSSPLAAYSPLHRDVLIPLVEAAADEHRIASRGNSNASRV